MEPDALTPGSTPYYEYVYNNESDTQPTYWPLIITQLQTKRAANELYTDDPSQYITYSGSWQSLLVAREKEGRYKNFTLRAYSGDSFNFYISIPSGQSSRYYSAPLTTSGNYSVLTEYGVETTAQQNPITFQAPDDNVRVYTLPDIKTVDWIRLHHQSVVSGETYRLYQFLPRTLIQVDDLEADVIDAVTIRVQDSIVIGPDMIGDKTLLGRKIVDGTVSGILLTDGTITGSKIVARTISGILITAGSIRGENIEAATISGTLITAGTITADRIATKTLTASQIADATITGSLIQAGTVSGVLITDNAISASKIQANTITGDKIAALTISGSLITADAITADKIAAGSVTAEKINVNNLAAVNTSTGSLLVSGTITVSGSNSQIDAGFTKLTQSGITVGNFVNELTDTNTLKIHGKVNPGGGNVVGMAIYNSINPLTPHAIFQTDFTNALEIENLAVSGVTNINIPQGGTYNSFNVWVGQGVPDGGSFAPQFAVGSLFTDFRSDVSFWGNDPLEEITVVNPNGVTTTEAFTGNRFFAKTAGTVTNPVFSFELDSDTGLFSQATNTLSLTAGNTEITRMTSSQILTVVGSTAAPVYSFIDDPDTGVTRGTTANRVVLIAGGSESFRVAPGQAILQNGSAATPSLIFLADADTGFFNYQTDSIGISNNGTHNATFYNGGQLSLATINANGQLTIEGGTRPTITLRQLNDANHFINFVCNTVNATTTPVNTGALGTYYGRARVQVNGTTRWIALYN